MMRKKIAISLMMAGCLFLSALSSPARANIIIKVRALNPLQSQEIAAISYPLPEEVSPSDIISKKINFSLPLEEGQEREDTFNVEYVQEEGRYFIMDEVVLGPREVATLEVHVRDIWTIAEGRLQGLKKSVEELIALYPPVVESPEEGEDPEAVDEPPDETAKMLQEEISEQIDAIAVSQPQSSVLKVGVEKHMEAYYESMEALAQVEADIAMLRYLLEPDEEEGEEGVEEEDEMREDELVGDQLLEEAPLVELMDLTFDDMALNPEESAAE